MYFDISMEKICNTVNPDASAKPGTNPTCVLFINALICPDLIPKLINVKIAIKAFEKATTRL
jgi:hypothetical protein